MPVTSPPGLPDPEPMMLTDELSAARLHAQNARLAEDNRRLAEENARLLHAQLLEENAALTRQNLLLKSGPPILLPIPAPGPALTGPPPGQLATKAPPPGNWAPPAAPPGRLQPDKAAPPGNWAAPASGRRRRTGTGSSEGSAASGSFGSGLCAPAVRLTTPSRESTAIGSSRDGRTDSSHGSIRSASASRSAAGSECSAAAGTARDSAEPADEKQHLQTTVMMRNVPNNYTRELLLKLLDAHGFSCKYNLVYLPIDFSSEAGFGYAFVNLVSTEEAVRFREHFQGFRGWELPSEKVCDVLWSAARQGLQANIERFRNSPVMHESVPDTFRPALFDSGERIPFPPPTRKPRAPDVGGGRAQ